MKNKKRILGRLGRIGSRAFVSVAALRQEARAEASERLERLAKSLKLVRREEFELVEEMVKKARALQEEILARLTALERAFAGKTRPNESRRAKRKSQAAK